MVETKIIKVKNGEVPIIKFGKGEKPFVILPGLSYDGFFDRAEEIGRSYSMFTEKFTVYLIDRNLYPKNGYGIKDMGDDTAEVFYKLSISGAAVFGASLGGMVAQQLAISYPHLVDKMVIGSTLSRPNANFTEVLTEWENIARSGDIDLLIDKANKKMYCGYTLKKYADLFRFFKVVATKEKTARFIAYARAAKGVDTYENLNKIKAKTLVIGVLKDKITTVSGARETAEKLNASYIEYRKYGHSVFDEARGYKKHIYDFLI